MKTLLKWALFAVFGVIALSILASFAYLYKKSQANPIVWKTEEPEVTDIIKKTVATGSVTPRQSVEVKPKVTGVLAELYVKPGDVVKKDQALGKITIIPDAQGLNAAEAQVRSSQIQLDNAKRELDREEELFKKGVVADQEVYKFRTDYALAKQSLDSAQQNLQLVREGSLRGQGKLSNVIVTATVDGTVIDVPVKVGYSLIQANSFNPGTTVATIANMNDMIFDGNVDESEVAKVKEGMKLDIKIGAIEKEHFEGSLEYIAPQGKEIDGAIQFEIKAALVQRPGLFIRAGYSANADIVIDQKMHVLAIREALVQYDDGKPFVEVETTPQTFVRHDVKLGVSDGIKAEVVSGVAAGDHIKVPENAGPPKADGSGSDKDKDNDKEKKK
ncbi:MAG TPA: efflux RND transporter periplasmic adaptor subunit [Kofleriaceae bacterium]|nr:efflux RND transporter periplasmic adaptor subunit [Kofleriaceae bacterium]